jgi:hypothetical protein
MSTMLGRPEVRSAAHRSLRVIAAGNEHGYVVFGNLIFGLESTEPSIPYINGFNATVTNLIRAGHSGVGIMVVIRPDAKPPSEEVRKHIVRVAREFAPHVLAFAHVIEGEGFLAAAKRAAMTFIMTTARLGFPLKVFSNMREAMPWLLKTVGPAFKENIRHDQLSALVEDVRKTHFPETGRGEARTHK